jgi:hypothetical protein
MPACQLLLRRLMWSRPGWSSGRKRRAAGVVPGWLSREFPHQAGGLRGQRGHPGAYGNGGPAARWSQ